MSSRQKVINVPPYQYIHVKDNNQSIIRVVTGPCSYIVQEHEELIFTTPKRMLIIPPMNYAAIKNPVMKNEKGEFLTDKNGQTKLADSEVEYRFHEQYSSPFYLHYGEELIGKIEKLQFVPTNKAICLKCLRSFVDRDGVKRNAGDEWIFIGPAVYYPTQEVQITKTSDASIIKPCHGLKLKAKQNFVDRDNIEHKAGEEWVVRKEGAYIPDIFEDVVTLLKPCTISDKQALHLRAIKSYKDVYGNEHRAGDEWLITPSVATWHVLDIYEELVRIEDMIVLSKDNFVVILNPVDDNGKNLKGSKKLVEGESIFFLQPGEELENGIQQAIILNENEAVLLQAKEQFVDKESVKRIPGDKWMIKGPCKFVPPIEVDILERRAKIPLDEREGIYVRDCKTGTVKSVIGQAYLLEANEELWEKELSDIEEDILKKCNPESKKRDKTRVVTYNCPYNSIMQIYNFKTDESRIVFGPDLVMLEPDEQFCLLFLSGKTPKVPGVVKTLFLNMGPTYTSDMIEVETSDHALLIIDLAYNWGFDVKKSETELHLKIFSVRDCIGEMCSIMASRVRGAVAEMTLNQFHTNSAKTIRKAVMGESETKKIHDKFLFENNLLAINNVDIRNISTKDKATKEKLQITVISAIESTTKSQEEEANVEAETREQEAKSLLQTKINKDNQEAEVLKKTLYEITSKTKSIEETGMKEALAKANNQKIEIESKSKIKMAIDKKELHNLRNENHMELETIEHKNKIYYESRKNEIEINQKEKLTEIETKKFQNIIDCIGQSTLIQISEAGPESQVKLLNALGLEGFIMTDGNNPINLFNFANNIAKK